MNKVQRRVLRLELAGAVFIILLGSMLHFTFELSGRNPVVGVFSAVNESVWEHLKLAYWPAVAYMGVEHRRLKTVGSFLTAKAIGICLMPVIIVSSFYAYNVFIEENLLLDILIFIVAVVTGQLASYRLMTRENLGAYGRISLITLVSMAIVFTVFTFHPPKLEVFRDPVSGNYGFQGFSKPG
ncbi:MAG: hypothetical protein FGF48_09780 [Candidatus Brockarchaeota archaeon]|nr:hypothetical protein [Candidatus Brockarchaeota archaeon]